MGVIRIVFLVIVLVSKTPGVLFMFLYKRHAGIRAFRGQLLRTGVEPDKVAELTKVYKEILFEDWKVWMRGMKRSESAPERS